MTPGAAAPLPPLASDPIVVLTADDAFAMPLAVAVRSAIDTLRPDARLRLFVLDGGISAANKKRLLRSWPEGRFSVKWIPVDASALADLPLPDRVGLTSYFRMLVPKLLPDDVGRAIYLDADIVVCADLARLWQEDMADHLCLAAQDPSAPYLDSSLTLANHECTPYIGHPRPIGNYRELGLNPSAPYFNAGVLVIDVDGWRREGLTERLLSCLATNKEHVLWWDQYALNVVLSGRWRELDGRWNQGAHLYKYPSWHQSPFDRTDFERQRDDPYIVHFTTSKKPWLLNCRHPLRQRYFDVLDRTAWAGWRPAQPGSLADRAGKLARRFTRVKEALLSRVPR